MKVNKGQLRNETWFLLWLEKRLKIMRISNDKEEFKKCLVSYINYLEQATGQKL